MNHTSPFSRFASIWFNETLWLDWRILRTKPNHNICWWSSLVHHLNSYDWQIGGSINFDPPPTSHLLPRNLAESVHIPTTQHGLRLLDIVLTCHYVLTAQGLTALPQAHNPSGARRTDSTWCCWHHLEGNQSWRSKKVANDGHVCMMKNENQHKLAYVLVQ